MRKEKKRALAQKRAAGELDENEEEKLRAPKRPRMSKEKPFCQLVVDLGFDEKMSDNVSGWIQDFIRFFSYVACTFVLSPSPSSYYIYPHSIPTSSTQGSHKLGEE